MSDLEALKNRLASEIADSGFEIEPRTAAALLENVAEYTALIPFSSQPEAGWDTFWMNNRSPSALAAIYQNMALADQQLPVQQAFLLALLQLLETPKALLNTVPARHRLLYYRDLLGFTPRRCQPDSVAVSFTLLRNTAAYLLPAGTALDAGQDQVGNVLNYLTDTSLLVTPQQLSQICWTRKDGDSWRVCTVQDQDNGILLPEDGIRLFSSTETESTLEEQLRLDFKLGALTGEITLEIAGEADCLLSGGAAQVLPFQHIKTDANQRTHRLSAAALQEARKKQRLLWEDPQLVLRSVVQDTVPESVQVTLRDCQQIDYRAQDGEGHINAFSFPFGLLPQTGNAFELTLPAEFSHTGGELTLQPHWTQLPPQSFAQWYAAYPDVPADNRVFTVRCDLLAADGTIQRGEDQVLFSGEGVPQAKPLKITVPADSLATTGYTLRVVLSGPDFFHHAWQNDPQGKNSPWVPQVTHFTTTFQTVLTNASAMTRPARASASAIEQQALYLGFNEVMPGETLSLYWTLNAPSALNLAWFYYHKDKAWVPLAAGVQDGTAGLSSSGLWQVVLPVDSAKGSEYANFTDDYYWIKAIDADGQPIIEENAARLRAVMAGAVTATLNTTNGVDNSHFAQPLPADTISQLVTPIAEISRVSQPLPSVGGQEQETQAALLKRAAIRIAHRQRGISWENMRSLLLDNYPQLYNVQFPDIGKLSRIPALEVQQLMVIPDSRFRDNDDVLRPRLNEQRLGTMADWLKQYCSLWATPKLQNPTYINVTARYRVLFNPGISPDWGYSQLATWLQQRYMPWGEDQRQSVTPGNQIDYYQLQATLELSPWVQRVTSLTLQRDNDDLPLQQSVIASDNEVLILIPTVADK